MPEEAHQEVKNADNNMEEKPEDNKHDYQTDKRPYPRTDLREIDHFLSINIDGQENPALTSYAVR